MEDTLGEFRQGYKTLSERAEERKVQAQARLVAERARGATEALEGAPQPRYNLWRCQEGSTVAYVKCPSRSGAKIFLSRTRGWGKKVIYVELVNEIPEEVELLTAEFLSVAEEAALDGNSRSK